VTHGDFSVAFVVVALVSLVSLFFFLRLPKDAGAQLTGPKPEHTDPRSDVATEP